MKILLVSTFDQYGAAKACIRLHESLLEQGVDSKLITLYKTNDIIENHFQFSSKDSFVKKLFRLIKYRNLQRRNKRILKNKPPGYEKFSFPESVFKLEKHSLFREADIVNIHWVAGFINFSNFFKSKTKKIVWTLHDMNAFTGGCHYSFGCKNFILNCNECPQLNIGHYGYAETALEIKQQALKYSKNVTIVCPSDWLLGLSKSSKVFKDFQHKKIVYGIDSDLYNMKDKNAARKELSLPINQRIILFASDNVTNKRKGFSYLIDAINMLETSEEVILCTIGSGQIENLKKPVIELGYIHDERIMSLLYSASDVLLIPSLEDNLPLTMLDCLMCGTPVIGFPVGGIRETIIDNENGLLTNKVDAFSLKIKIEEFLKNIQRFDSDKIRTSTEAKFALKHQADEYISLFKKQMNE